MKVCTKCLQGKPLAAFSRMAQQADGLDTRCRACKSVEGATYRGRLGSEQRLAYDARKRALRAANPEHARVARNRLLLKKYGITLADYEQRLMDQGGVCKICGTAESGLPSGSFAVDHDHETGVVRGLLCGVCNIHVGYVERAGLERVLAYLNGSQVLGGLVS